MPFKVGTVAGLFFGLAFGLGGIGAALIGHLADLTSIQFMFKVCSFLPALGLFAALLPHIETRGRKAAQVAAPVVDAAGPA
jgi:FSR family fosmidomycin resistance protein-like MFS transporter